LLSIFFLDNICNKCYYLQAMNRPYPFPQNGTGITMSSSQETDYYTVAQAAKVLAVSPSTIWRWIKADILPAYRVGPRKIRIKKEDLFTIITPAGAKEGNMEKLPKPIEPKATKQPQSLGKPLTFDDPLWKLVGAATEAQPTDSSKKHEYLAEA
jgi:excisionase family DNA binding protein